MYPDLASKSNPSVNEWMFCNGIRKESQIRAPAIFLLFSVMILVHLCTFTRFKKKLGF
jgi:hypothetical protein